MRDFQASLAYLWGLKRLGTRPGPEVTAAILRELGDPHRTFRSIHITGSKGKGSVAAMCASVLQAAGYRTGLYTSPHLLSFRERARVNGENATPEDLVDGLARVRKAIGALERAGRLEREPTFFEVTTAWAFDLFRRKKVEVAAIEVGLGGRLDSTNVLAAPVTVVTMLELEHTELLGPTIQDIAREKAGIFHRAAWAVTGAEEGPGLEALRHHAFQLGVPLWVLGREVRIVEPSVQGEDGTQQLEVVTPHRRHPRLTLPLLGTFQLRNAAVAVAALDLFERSTGTKLPEGSFAGGLASVRWPGRLERVGPSPPFYVDAAHTPVSARELVSSLASLHSDLDPEESVVLFSCLIDKRAEEMLGELARLARRAVLFPLGTDRAMASKDLARAARGLFVSVFLAPNAEQGIAMARATVGKEGLLIATGSVYLAGQVLSVVRKIPMEGPDLSDPVGRTLTGWTSSPPTSSSGPAAKGAKARSRPASARGRTPGAR